MTIMTKTFKHAGILFSCVILAAFTSCGETKKGSQADGGTKSRTVKAEEVEKVDTKDIFFFTPKHRSEKYQPTEPKMAFTKEFEHVKEGEFEGNTNIKEIWFSQKMNHIQNNAFKGCTSLEKVHFQGPVAVINDNAFEGCTALKNLTVDAYTVGVESFKGCKSLTTAHFGEHIWWIRIGAFKDCSNLKSILLTITMKKLEDGAFEGCNAVEELTIPNDFKNRMFGMFADCKKMKKIYLLATEFYEMPKNCTPYAGCTLYVPDAFLKQYQADAEWSKFGKIEPLSKSAYYTAEGFLRK